MLEDISRLIHLANLPWLYQWFTSLSGIQLERAAYRMLGIVEQTGPARPTELASASGIDNSTASRQVRSLEQLGLVRIEPDLSDSRASLVTLSESGRHILDVVRAGREEAMRLILEEEDWSDQEKRQFCLLLEKYVTSLEKSRIAITSEIQFFQ